jgi:pyruvate/oxaloacetate carboxyltransferase
METRNYVMGLYGEAPGKISDEIKHKVLGKKEPIACRPADLLKPGLDQARKDAGAMARSEEDVITYALFPEIAKDFFQAREAQGGAKPPLVSQQALA